MVYLLQILKGLWLRLFANYANRICLVDPLRSLAVYRFCIAVNPADVIELDPLLGDLVLHHPLKATTLFQSVSKKLVTLWWRYLIELEFKKFSFVALSNRLPGLLPGHKDTFSH